MMKFEDEDREEEEEDEDEDEEDDETTTTTTLLTPSYKTSSDKKHHSSVARYKECLKNHAVTIGGHALDGCGEFMPAGPDNTLDSLKCAACNCHRNFHRREPILLEPTNNHHQQLTVYTPRPTGPHHTQPPPHVYQFYPYNRTTPNSPPSRALALPPPAEDHVTGGLGMGLMTMTMTSSSGKKRHRTKFSQEQKDQMLELAERLGWRIQKQDETVVQQFCDQTGVKRHVLKVWMHNNKHTLGKKLPSCDPSNVVIM